MFNTYLGIDYGTKRVGVAIATTFLAEPLVVLANTPQLLEELQQLIQERRPAVIVIGISEREMAEQTRQFAAQLEAYLQQHTAEPPRIVFADETLSSVEVYEKLHQSGKRDIRQKGPIDHYVAAHILQEYLDLHQLDESQ
mgnify:CR=1 FL=1